MFSVEQHEQHIQRANVACWCYDTGTVDFTQQYNTIYIYKMKEAVVFIIDTSPSMNTPYPTTTHQDEDSVTTSTTTTTTRLECAKQVVVSMISDLILKSKTNEVSVILCHTLQTKHHKIAATNDDAVVVAGPPEEEDDLPFPHLTELTPGIVRPTAALLRQIMDVQSTLTDSTTTTTDNNHHNNIGGGGDVCDAIILAADAFHERGTHYKFQRKMILLTDAAAAAEQHPLVLDVKSMLVMIDTLRSMACPMLVLGFDFDASANYPEPMAVPSTTTTTTSSAPEETGRPNIANKRMKAIKEEEGHTGGSGNSHTNNKSDMDFVVYSTKHDREQLLISLTEKTGGAVIAVSTLQQLLQAQQGRRIPNSVLTKFEFRLAPKISFEARFFLLMSKQSFPKLITKAVKVVQDYDTTSRTTTSLDTKPPGTAESQHFPPPTEDASFDVQRAELFVDPDEPDDVVTDENRTKAIYFGSTLIPLSSFDYEGLKPSQMGARLEVLGYMPRSKVPLEYISGPPSGISGHDSPKACAAISSMANALHRLDKVAIGTFFKRSTSTKPLLVILLPYQDPESTVLESSLLQQHTGIHLAILQIPFGGETKKLDLDCFDDYLDVDSDGNAEEDEKTKACDDLIASLMLPEHILCSGQIPSPLLRSCNQTKVQRALNPKADIVCIRSNDDPCLDDPTIMVTPPDLLSKAAPFFDAFETAFGLDKVVVTKMDAAAAAAAQKSKNQTTGRRVLTYKDFV